MIRPEAFAFLLERHYEVVEDWVLTGKLDPKHHNLAGILTIHQDLIHAWIKHNQIHHRMAHLNGAPTAAIRTIGLIDFYDLYQATNQDIQRIKRQRR